MKETPTCEQLEMMADKTHFCTMVKQKEMIWKVAYPNSTPAERLSWILLRQSEGIVSGFMTYLENKVKELGDADTNDLVEFMNMRAETREKAYGTKVLEFWNMERKKGENTMDFGARLQTLARRVDKIIWEKLVIQKLLIEIDDYTLFLINSTIDETTDLATVLKKILDAEDVTHGREFKKGETKKKELKLTCWFCKESDHKKEECKKWKDAGSPVYNFTTRTWETGQLKICNNDLAAMREIEICGKTKEVFLDSGSTENWMSLENAKNLGVELKPTSGVSACMADGSALKAIAMFDCEVDFKNGKGIQVLRFYVPVKGNDIIIGWRVLKNNCDLFEIGSDNDTSVESSLTADHSENEVLQDCKDEGHETSVMVEREEVLKFIEQCQQKVESIEKRTPISLELRDGLTIEDIQLKRDYRRKVKNIFSGGLQAYLDKEERSGMISRVYDIPRIVSPIHIVKKKNADEHAVDDKIPCDFMRVCVDYSELNQFLAKREVDLIRLESVIDMVSGSEYLSTMDVSAAYKALPLDEHSKELTCFYTPYGIYKAETLPFGLATAPALFVAEIRKSLKMIKSTNFTFYMDDFLFYGPVAQQIQAIKEVTEALTKRGWSWNLEKCEILKPQVHFIGYQISGTEWEIPDEKIKKLLDMTPPKNAKELASLRGKLLYFSRLIPEFGAITSVWDGSKFRWEEDEQKAFETIMSILKRNPKITTIPEGAQVVVVVVNQHKNSISSALYWFTDKSHGVACWCSRKSTATERNYSVLDRWTVAIYEMMNQPRLKHCKVFIHCDGLEQSRRIRPPYDEEMLGHPKSKRVCGMLFTLSLMNLEPINLPKAKDDVVALSLGVLEQCYSIKKDEKENIGHLKLTTVENELIQEARADLDYMNMFKGVFDGVYRHLEKHQLSLTGERNVMALNGKLIVPVGSGKRIVAKIHKDYHEGTRNLTNRINTYFIIHGLTKLIKEVISECKICQMFRKNGPCKTLIWTPAVEPRERGHMDFFFFSGKTIFLLTDSFSAYPFAKVIKRKSDFLEVLKEIVALFGDFELLVSDNEPVFQSEEVAGWLEERGTLHFFVPTYSPRSNGLAEGMVNILKNKMKKAQEEMNLNVEESLTWALISVRTVSDYKGMSRIDKFVGKRSMGKKWFQDIRFESVSQPVYFKVSPNQTWTEGQLIWTIGQRIKGVLADGIVHMLPAERVHGRKEDLKEADDDSAVNDEQVVSSNQEITQLLKNGGFKYPAGVFFTDGSTKQENGYGVVGLLLPEEGKVKVKVYAQRGIKHGSCGPSANRLEIMAVKVALEIAQDMNLQQVYIFSDSRNLTGAYSEGWIDNWRDNGFSRLSNSSLYKAVDDLVQKIPQVHIKRVAAHNGVFLNECADELAKGGDPDEITNKVNNWLKSKLCETSPEEEVEEEKDPDE